MSRAIHRGQFIVFEGIDRCGKSTQSQKLKDAFEKNGKKVILQKFPNRETRGAYNCCQRFSLSLKWCAKHLTVVCLKPHCVFFLNLQPEIANCRKGAGEERYEQVEFQKKVLEQFMKLKDETWKIIDANQSEDKIFSNIYQHALSLNNQELIKLWTTDF
ncbi:thymidylate kinase [Octopus sinensis]|uniref:Thymidylate kinase n=1 Tax=Octopus sinensis TaxID=2607531 RepID=A0A6P7TFA7_9MOLL|nr:thymidylate kinase [Octopus sinensis]